VIGETRRGGRGDVGLARGPNSAVTLAASVVKAAIRRGKAESGGGHVRVAPD